MSRNYNHNQRNPELAYRRAEELINSERDEDALTILQEVIKNRRYRQWQSIHPSIMKLYINLCIKLKKSQIAKEGLFQCKSMTQHQHPEELEKVIKNYIATAKARVKSAKKASKESLNVLQGIDDLDCIITPEALLLRVTAAEDTDRADREHLTPWVKFLWDCYRQCLDLLKNNTKLERMYCEVASEACKFCVDFERNNEFRKLSDTLRQHLKNMTDSQSIKNYTRRDIHLQLVAAQLTEQHYITQQYQTDIRLQQLKTAIALKLWQEANKSIEDIHIIMQFTRRVPKSYANLAKFKSKFFDYVSVVLLKAGQPLFHAATCHKIFYLNRDLKKDISIQNLKKLASQTLVATLAVPLTEKQHGLGRMLDMGQQAFEKHQKMSKILNYERLPTREQLVQDIQYRGVINHVPHELTNLFKCLEIEFNPLRLSTRVDECLKWLVDSKRNPFAETLSPYINQIQHVTASRVINHISQIYESIDFTRILAMVPFYDAFELEQHILDACRTGELRAKIDHSTSTVSFGSRFDPAPLCVQPSDDSNLTNGRQAEGKDWLNDHLNIIHKALSKSSAVLRTNEDRKKRDEKFQLAAKLFKYNDEKTVHDFAMRKEIIEEAKEDKERKEKERIEKIERDLKMKEQKAKTEEKNRIDAIVKERDEEKAKTEEREAKLRYAVEKLAELKKDDKTSSWIEYLEPDDLLDMTQEQVIEKQIDGVRKSRIESKKFLTKVEDDKDYLERAKRQVERKYREETLAIRMQQKTEVFNRMRNEAYNKSKKAFELEKEFKLKFEHMNEKIQECIVEVKEVANTQYNKELDEYDDMKNQSILERRKQLTTIYKEETRKEWLDKIKNMNLIRRGYEEEQSRLKKEEEERRKREEKQQQQREMIEQTREQRFGNRRPDDSPQDQRDGGYREQGNKSPERAPRRFIGRSNNATNNTEPGGFRRIHEPTDNEINRPRMNDDTNNQDQANEQRSDWRRNEPADGRATGPGGRFQNERSNNQRPMENSGYAGYNRNRDDNMRNRDDNMRNRDDNMRNRDYNQRPNPDRFDQDRNMNSRPQNEGFRRPNEGYRQNDRENQNPGRGNEGPNDRRPNDRDQTENRGPWRKETSPRRNFNDDQTRNRSNDDQKSTWRPNKDRVDQNRPEDNFRRPDDRRMGNMDRKPSPGRAQNTEGRTERRRFRGRPDQQDQLKRTGQPTDNLKNQNTENNQTTQPPKGNENRDPAAVNEKNNNAEDNDGGWTDVK